MRELAFVVFVASTGCGDDGASKTAAPTQAETKSKAEPAEAPEPEPEPEPEPGPAPTPARIEIGHVSTADAIVLRHLYWTEPQYLLGGPHALVVGGTVRQLAKMKPDNPRMRGSRWVFEARVEIERTFLGQAPKFVVAELADNLAVGDAVIVFAREHEGELGLVEAKASNARLGIAVESWEDPIVGVLADTLAGTADLEDEAVAAAWQPFGEPAIACARAGTPVARCE